MAYGGFVLLNDINFHISESDKIGLVGKNGAGKSTILKLICGLQSPTNGKVAVPNDVKIGYLPQIMEHHRGRSVIDEAMTAFAEMFDLEAELEKITVELSEREDYESKEYQDLIVRMNEVNDRLAYTRSDNPQVLAERTLLGLGFKYEELQRPTETFSQGWNMRIELAKILLSKPDVLLLDEPTSHLDTYAQLALEKAIDEYEGAVRYKYRIMPVDGELEYTFVGVQKNGALVRDDSLGLIASTEGILSFDDVLAKNESNSAAGNIFAFVAAALFIGGGIVCIIVKKKEEN